MPRTRVKICGITRPQDATLAAELGADAIGLNFVGGPRRVTEDQAKQIYWSLRDDDVIVPRIDIVALVNIDQESPDWPWHGAVKDFWYTANAYQIYSEHYDRLSESSRLPGEKWWMVVPIKNRESLVDLQVVLAVNSIKPTAILLDTASPDKLGGTGQSFNWNWIAEAREAGELNGLPPLILAGGLNPDNVADAIRIAKPYAVDVSSGVEVPGKPGIKDPIKMRDFIQAAQNADST